MSRLRKKLESQQKAIDKLNAIRALWVGGHTTQASGDKVSQEFYYAVGDLLEGVSLQKILPTLKSISSTEVLQVMHDNS